MGRTSAWRSCWLIACAWGVGAGCSHTHFQVRLCARQADQVAAVISGLQAVVANGSPAALAGWVDPVGRKALLTFALTRLLDRLDPIVDSLRAAQLTALAAGAWSLLSAPSAPGNPECELADRLQRSLAERLAAEAEQAGRSLWRLAGQLVGPQAPFDPADLGNLARNRMAECRWGASIVSYRTGLMRYRDWGKAEYSYAFRRFKQRLERLDFVRLDCPGQKGLFVLASYMDRERPAVLLWWFFSDASWPAVERQLAGWFELDS